ncbi:hypothetical protein [Ramlibacter sp. WS9]|uniref:hypothetical protein n=1 Tax=Ramlibacter sp. WS9 TaxID=1882741 RepID=UPI0011450A7D|nr:hypothetical protein [Ramlibacter sp. WS9]ROZ63202.1 hypothetical protein EEB15_30140 [Ramlibacter sp. WS9]
MNRSRYIPSATLLLHIGVVVIAAFVATTSAMPVQLAPTAAPVSGARSVEEILLEQPARFRLGLGHAHELPAGSRWRAIGSLAQGTVYRPLNLVFMLDGVRADEAAYAVVKGGKLQGVYLPVGAQFSRALSATPLVVQKPAA